MKNMVCASELEVEGEEVPQTEVSSTSSGGKMGRVAAACTLDTVTSM